MIYDATLMNSTSSIIGKRGVFLNNVTGYCIIAFGAPPVRIFFGSKFEFFLGKVQKKKIVLFFSKHRPSGPMLSIS